MLMGVVLLFFYFKDTEWRLVLKTYATESPT